MIWELSLASKLDTTVASKCVFPILTSTEPWACFANFPVVRVISLPSSNLIITFSSFIIVIFMYKIKKAIEIAFILVGYYLLRPRSFTSSLYLTISLFIR